ncbi:MAG: tetratricopeptide repeat protein [Candidatus Omnitrophica bacterium]|nr:tetratricopeptide repeat protein [Candidatus Omnitrophota bacterium]
MKKFFSWAVTISAVLIIVWFVRLLLESKEALRWPQIPGTVISSSLTIDHLPSYLDWSGEPWRWYGVDVRYQYSLGDITYTSNSVAIRNTGYRNPKAALKIMNAYRRMRNVEVFYNPGDPKQSFLEPANLGDLFMPGTLAFLMLVLWLLTCAEGPLELKPYDVHDYQHWGNFYLKRNKFDEALQEFNKIIEVRPNLSQGYKIRGNLYFQHEKWDEAIADFNQAKAIDPTDPQVFLKLGQAHLAKKQYNKAWEHIRKAMDMGLKVKSEILEEIQYNVKPEEE